MLPVYSCVKNHNIGNIEGKKNFLILNNMDGETKVMGVEVRIL